MKKSNHKAIAIVGVGAVMPDAPSSPEFWKNIKDGKYSISEVPGNRWDADKYFDTDRKAPDKTYSKIGGWVTKDNWDPLKWRLPIPPKVSAQMDLTQRWAVTAAREALLDFDYLNKDFDRDRTAVILGVAMGGDQHLYSAARIFFPEYVEMLTNSQGFSTLPVEMRKKIIGEMNSNLDNIYPGITEDTMPGELSNIVAGRIASLFNFHGPNYIADAACASAMAGMTAAIEGLKEYDYDLVITGGIDANMSPSTFVKFCKIGALSASGTRPYADGADGFVMGEGGAVFILKRLEDAERDQDKIYAVIRSIAGSSDGKGKGITAPNPVGQTIAVQRAWENSGVSPSTVSLIEGHGTSTSVGDAVELKCLHDVFQNVNIPKRSVALGSVKSNIGHLKGAAGAAGIMKAAMALHEKLLPPSLNFNKPNAGFDFDNSPFAVNTQLRSWDLTNGHPRRCGVSAFGFGGTNFHAVLEEYIPGKIISEEKTRIFVADTPHTTNSPTQLKSPLRGAYVKGANSINTLISHLELTKDNISKGWTPETTVPSKKDLLAPIRIAIDFGNVNELGEKITKAIKGLNSDNRGMWKPLNANGIFLGKGPSPKTAFLFTGQGSQYINMLKELKDIEPVVAKTFEEADQVMTPLLGKPLSDYIFLNTEDKHAIAEASKHLMQTEITQPAVLTADIALYRLMIAYGVNPDYVIGHSLGEYGALVASKAISFANALKAVSARGSEMAKVEVKDKGIMAAVFGSPQDIQKVLDNIEGYVEIANINSYGQSVIGGETEPVKTAMKIFKKSGFHVAQLPVSHAFHTRIVAPASGPLGKVLEKGGLESPRIPIIANVTGDFYPTGPGVVSEMSKLLSLQVASPVQFVKGINKLYDQGVRVFIEMGPKKALNGFVRDIMSKNDDVLNLFTNHPKVGALTSFNQGLCGMYASGLGHGIETVQTSIEKPEQPRPDLPQPKITNQQAQLKDMSLASTSSIPRDRTSDDRFMKLGHLFVDFMEKANAVYADKEHVRPSQEIWITGASLGLPKVEGVFQDSNVEKLLNGNQFIGNIPAQFQQAMLDKNITRLVKTGKGGPRFETISQIDEVIKLAARKNNLNIVRDFGFPQTRKAAIDSVTELAIGAGIDALRDAGIPLVMHYKTTTTGSKLPDRWLLPDEMKDDTGIIFASAFPGYNSYAKEMTQFFENKIVSDKLALLQYVRTNLLLQNGSGKLLSDLDNRIEKLQNELIHTPYSFNRRFLLRVLSMGHSQFAEYIGARGPNTQINSACASTTLAVGLAKDWIEAGRCKRVIIIAGDDITSDETIGWFSSGFLAVGAAATDEKVENAALPFDKRRHGMIVGMGGVSIVVENGDSARKRGINPICEVLGSAMANSAFHGTRLDVSHIRLVMEKMISEAEQKWGIDRFEIADQMVFVSHETYTPARGGSASAEINALRFVFKSAADKIIIANTKGMTGHAMAVGIEDVLAIKSLETGIVPPVPNFKEVDPELGLLNLSKGGKYPIRYALRLGAGFGSQISMSLLRWTPTPGGIRPNPSQLGYAYRITDQSRWKNWLKQISDRENPEMEVVKRTLRIKDPFGETLSEYEETHKSDQQPAPVVEQVRTNNPIVELEEIPGHNENSVKNRILELIADKTGYPADMLDPDLDLEADLGIDTVKQAELFAEIRGEYGIERDDNLQLSEFPTLHHIIQFVFDKRPDLKQANPISDSVLAVSSTDTTQLPKATQDSGENGVKNTILSLISDKTGYPADMLDPELDLEADLGIDTVKQAELFAEIRGEYGIERDDNLQLSEFPTLNHIIQFVFDKKPELKRASVISKPLVITDQKELTVVVDPGQNIEGNEVKETILMLISEKTGYPTDMLDPELDLEADLGIDTVKQAELFAEIRGEYGIERDENLQLSEFPTLNHIIQFVFDKRPDLTTPPDISKEQAQLDAPDHTNGSTTESVDSSDGVLEKVLQLVAEKTGYPVDMLDPELDLEADLGIDTVKQAELFAEIRAEYDIQRDDTLELSEFPTLNHIVQFVYDRRPKSTISALEEDITSNKHKHPTESNDIIGSFEAVNQIPRRIPVPVLRPSLLICKSSGIILDKNSHIVVMPDQGGIGKSLISLLNKKGAKVRIVDKNLSAQELQEKLKEWMKDGPIHGVFWLPALDNEGEISHLTYTEWKEATNIRVKLLYTTMRELILSNNKSPFLISATRMGGLFGYDIKGAHAPLGGAVSGFTKAFKREHVNAQVKVVDFGKSRKTRALAQLLIDEVLYDTGVVEVAYKDEKRWTISFEEQPHATGNSGMKLTKDSKFLVTGAAGSITSAIVADLAKASGGTFFLLDLIPVPDRNNPDLNRFITDKDGLKRDLFQRIANSGEKATPVKVDKALAAIERSHSAMSAIRAVENAGGKAHYYSVNLLNHHAISEVIEDVMQKTDQLDVLLHAGGIEISHLLPAKSSKEFDLVFDIKADGWYNLLSAFGNFPIGATVVFSSIAGRFGNGGQTDYSAANDFLCKSTSNFKTTRPNTRGIALDWTAWKDIGMAARGSIPTVMKQAGIDMLPPEAGIPFIRRELMSYTSGNEVIVAQSLGMMLNEFDETGGLDLNKDSTLYQQVKLSNGVMIQEIMSMGNHTGLTVKASFDPKIQGFLFDHEINGIPVLPGVMGIEAMVEAAKVLHPDIYIQAVKNVDFLAPFKFYRSEPREVIVNVKFTPNSVGIEANCQLIGTRRLHGQEQDEIKTHFKAQVLLSKESPDKPPTITKKISPEKEQHLLESGDIYKVYFHGPTYQVVKQSWKKGKSIIGLFAENLPLNHQPDSASTIALPRLVELCFQTAGIWEMGENSRMGLPMHIDKLELYKTSVEGRLPLYAIVDRNEGAYDASVVDGNGNVYLRLKGYQTAEYISNVDENLLEPLKLVVK